jgi:phosphatidate cytidylyltransferase
MGKRILGSSLLFITAAAILFLGKCDGMAWLLAFCAIGAQVEFLKLLKKMHLEMLEVQVMTYTAIILLGAWYLPPICGGIWLMTIAFIAMLIHCVASGSPQRIILPLAPSVLAILYIPFSLQFGILIMRSSVNQLEGLLLLLWTILVCKSGDVGAFLVGTIGGKHKLSEQFSPKKTWEGLLGGIVTSVVVGIWLGKFAQKWPWQFPLSQPFLIVLSFLLGIVSPIGDLLESAFKRAANVKDSGNCIPGIGGFLDFCDSLVLALPTSHLFLLWMNILPQ